jgi:predicted nucleotidyltransferase
MELQKLSEIVRKELKPSLQKHLYGVLTYGSAARGDYVPGWSDFDILIVPNYNFVCPREFYDELASWYTSVRKKLEENGIDWGIEEEVSFSVYDLGTVKSGRYAWMIRSFRDHLRKSGRIFWTEGKDIKDILSEKFPQAEEEYSLAYALWRTRVTASSLDYYKKYDQKQFKYEFKKSVKALKNFFRNAVILNGEKLRSDYSLSIAKQFTDAFPEINSEEVLEVLAIPNLWPNLSQEEMTNLFFTGLRIREETIKSLAEKP